MIKLFKHLKPHIFGLCLCLILLFGQATCDLSLPNYMSEIVNVGIQKGGIKNPTPEFMSEDALKLFDLFLDDDKKEVFKNSYSYSETKSSEYNKKVYVLNADANVSDLDLCFSKATMALIEFFKSSKQSSSAKNFSQSNIDISLVYKMIPQLSAMPKTILEQAKNSASDIDPYLSSQAAVAFTKYIYKDIGINTNAIQNQYILNIGMMMLLITLLGATATVIVSFLASRISADFARTIRKAVFSKVESFSNSEMNKFSTASLITRTTNDITQIQTFVMMGVRLFCYAPIMGVGGIVMALNKSVSMSWVIALAVTVLMGLILIILVMAMPKFKIFQSLVDRLNLVAREHLSGIMVIRAFGTQKFESERFDQANRNLRDINLFIGKLMNLLMPAIMLIMNGISLLIVWVGANKISESTMQVGDMMAFMQYSIQIIMAFMFMSMMFIFLPRAAVSAGRIREVLELDLSIKDPVEPKKISKNHRGKIEFKNVSFSYENAEDKVLDKINFIAQSGQTTAFIGATGSGKSTLINLIPRFYDVTEGQILVDDIDIRDLSMHDLRSIIGYVPQKGILFSGDIESNLRYGDKNAKDDELKQAAKIAQSIEFIESQEEKFKSLVSQGGNNFSGGQKQRLSIARALVKKAPIYIFDDSFSALDFKTDVALRYALKKYTSHSTVLIVAQRVSTIMHSDQIVVLNEGKVVGIGTHKELLKTCEEYKEIAMSQLSKEELG